MKTMFVIAVLAAALSGPARADPPPRQIHVTGEGYAEAVPDMATVSVGVTSEAQTAGAAMEATSAAVARILDRLGAQGIAPRDIQTQRLTLNPVWAQDPSDSGRSRITGYTASNIVAARVRDLDRLGPVLDLTIAAGANDFNGLHFSVQEPEPLVAAARQAAVADAMNRARQLAAAAGVKLGPVVSIVEQGGGGPQPMMMEAGLSRSDMPVAAGEVSLGVSVTMVFAIAE